jgi:hypothetical protein
MTRQLSRTTALRALVALLAPCWLSSIGHAQPEASPYAGRWRGVIAPITPHGVSDELKDSMARPREFIIRITKDWVPHVEARTPRDLGSTFERSGRLTLPLSWTLNRVGAEGVVIYAHNASQWWAETQVFTIARSGEDTLLVQYWRVVNNVGVPPEEDGSKWALGGHGEFRRVGRRD